MRLCLYSCLVGEYDDLPQFPDEPGVTRILFSDRPRPTVTYPVRLLEPSEAGVPPVDGRAFARRLSRAPKLRPHRFLPAHDVSIWADANLVFHRGIRDWVLACLAGADVAAFRHPNPRSRNVREQAALIKQLGLDYPEVVDGHWARMRACGFPDDQPLTENCLLLRRNTEAVNALNERWWREYCAGSLRDQMSFQFSLWRCPEVKLALIPGHSRHNEYYTQIPHLGSRQLVPIT